MMACEYCNGKGRMFNFPEKWLIEKSQTIGDYDEPTIDVLVIGNELVATSERDHRGYSVEERTLIHFCPMCGEKLGEPMSDCSTEVVKPKEPPKTCGTCGTSNCDYLDNWCSNYTSRTDTLEQRYAQLEHVACDMWKFMLSCAITIDDEEEAEPFKIQLEALGVRLDD